MEALIESIRAAVATNASVEVRAAGAHACRTILTALEATAGQPMSAAPVAHEIPTATPIPHETTRLPPTPSQIASMVGVLRNVPPEQLLDLAIAKLRSVLPPETQVAPVRPLKFHIVSPRGVSK